MYKDTSELRADELGKDLRSFKKKSSDLFKKKDQIILFFALW
jgi:hypothetical protein